MRACQLTFSGRPALHIKLFAAEPTHPSLRFKQVHQTRPICSARVGLGYRALGVREGEDIVWFWIGSHAEYDRLIDSL